MPTGYTAKLVESGQTFEEFALTCARAFGALIDMREEPLDKPIPETIKPITSYHTKALAEAEKELVRLMNLTVTQQLAVGKKKRNGVIKSAKQSLKKTLEENSRIDTMVKSVRKWSPPTKDHEELKKFMIQQLEISRHNEISGERWLRDAEEKSEIDYFGDYVDSANRSIEYHKEHIAKEKVHATDRTEWIQQLRKSLK